MFLGEPLEVGHWVGTSGQHEDEGGFDGGISVALGEVEGRRDDVLLAQFGGNEVLNARDQFVRS